MHFKSYNTEYKLIFVKTLPSFSSQFSISNQFVQHRALPRKENFDSYSLIKIMKVQGVSKKLTLKNLNNNRVRGRQATFDCKYLNSFLTNFGK